MTLTAELRPVARADTVIPNERVLPGGWPANPLEKSA